MPLARLSRWVLRAGCALGLGLLAACSNNGAATPAPGNGGDDGLVATSAAGDVGDTSELTAAPTPTAGPQVPEGVPVLETAFDLAVTSDGSYIAYKAPESFEQAVAFYQTGLADAGWERINKNDAAFGSSTTLLRARPEATISVTIQAVPGNDNAVRVLISYTKK